MPTLDGVRTPTAEQLQTLLDQIIQRIMKALTRHGALIEEESMTFLAEMKVNTALVPLQSVACTYRIALDSRAGQKVLTLKTLSTQSTQQPQSSQSCCANAHGFSLHAGVRCAMNQRGKLERLCRYITRPAIAEERLARNKDGQVVLMLKTPYRDGTTHSILSPLEFMQRLTALVPRSRLNLIRFHGVLAPNAKLRSEIIPGNKKNKSNVFDTNDDVPHPPASVRISWARLLKRASDIDIEHGPHCGGILKIIAAILESGAITKILDHLGLSSRALPRSPAQVFDPFGSV